MYTRESDVEKMGQVSLLLLKHVVVIVVVVVDLDFVAVAAVIVVILVILSPHLNLRCTAGTSALRVSSLVSVPHFLNANPYYLSLVQSGLSPVPTLHGTSFKVEPLSH